MPDYDNKFRGALFKNDKEGNEKRPDYKGNYTDGDGNEFYVSAWIKESKKGDKFMSLSMEPKENKEQAQTPKKEQAHTPKQEYAAPSDDQGLPF